MKLRFTLGFLLFSITGVAIATPQCPSSIEATDGSNLDMVLEDGVEVDGSAYAGYQLTLNGSEDHFTLYIGNGNGSLREIYNAK